MKIYTKTGDGGDTSLFGGGRVSKSDARVCAYGEVDELNAWIGRALADLQMDDSLQSLLLRIQRTLFGVGGELATREPTHRGKLRDLVTDSDIESLETSLDAMEVDLPPLKSFVLPGGGLSSSALHVARAVCRRAERSVVALAATEPLRPELVKYLNRLSDWLFVAARHVNFREGRAETLW
ncbi:MAG: cob(I)yrinic acid a,c-diamide adenosyltransferase [bacterium]